ncbi:DUF11 domain-containing protein [Leucobacter sp. USHLN153]|uniref:DUF11 domain-containing protein n=1 Tax=Leucobacter sp. USHLN153 TaxID=3081268 RepID=UPI003016A89D
MAVPLDFGDAPESYGTLLADDGARHGLEGFDEQTLAAPLMLGADVTRETDGLPVDGDVDDALSAAPKLVQSFTSSVEVTVTNAADEDAALVGWIDSDFDGVFDEAESLTQVPVAAGSGTSTVQLELPAISTLGQTWLRLRLSHPGGEPPLPTAAIDSGEVKDWAVTVVEPAPAIALTKAVSSSTYSEAGEVLTYTVIVSNTGNVPVTELTVNDPLCTLEGSATEIPVAASESFTCDYEVTETDFSAGEIVNTAAAGAIGAGTAVSAEGSATTAFVAPEPPEPPQPPTLEPPPTPTPPSAPDLPTAISSGNLAATGADESANGAISATAIVGIAIGLGILLFRPRRRRSARNPWTRDRRGQRHVAAVDRNHAARIHRGNRQLLRLAVREGRLRRHRQGRARPEPCEPRRLRPRTTGQRKKLSHDYVTPLNPRGTSASIVGIGTITGSTMEAGELNNYTVYRYPKGETRQANSAVADTITGSVLDGYKASGLTVFEVVPAADGNWVASIGKAQSILYRASIAPDGTIVLLEGDEPATAENAKQSGKPYAKVTLAKPLAQMAADELHDLGDQVFAELAQRALGARTTVPTDKEDR